MHLLSFDSSSSFKNQMYVEATSANANNQYVYTAFTAKPNGYVFAGCLWVRFTAAPSAVTPAILASVGEGIGATTKHQYLGVITSSAGKVKIILGTGTINADGTATGQHEIETEELTAALNQWHKIQFFYSSDFAVPTDNSIKFDNVATTPVLRTGAPVATSYAFTLCRLFQHSIPINTRIANVWLHVGALTKLEVDSWNFGLKAPVWLGDAGARNNALYPATVYMHGAKKIFENSVNDAVFSANGGAFASLIQATNRTDFVRIP